MPWGVYLYKFLWVGGVQKIQKKDIITKLPSISKDSCSSLFIFSKRNFMLRPTDIALFLRGPPKLRKCPWGDSSSFFFLFFFLKTELLHFTNSRNKNFNKLTKIKNPKKWIRGYLQNVRPPFSIPKTWICKNLKYSTIQKVRYPPQIFMISCNIIGANSSRTSLKQQP